MLVPIITLSTNDGRNLPVDGRTMAARVPLKKLRMYSPWVHALSLWSSPFHLVLPLQSVQCSYVKLIADSIVIRCLENKQKIQMELYSNGFVHNSLVNTATRISFAGHASDDHVWSGGFNMSLNSQIALELKFDQTVDYRVFAVQYQRVHIDGIGIMTSSLE